MLFNSLEFVIFLPLVFFLYWFVFNKSLKWQNLFIVVVSYIFYGWWDWRFLLLIAFTSFCSWFSGVMIEKSCEEKTIIPQSKNKFLVSISKLHKPKVYLWFNIIVNLLILGFFKYYNFFVESFIDVFACMGIAFQATTLSVVLPVGISFYTFQALSYSIDVYRRKIDATYDIVAFFAFVSFFPQLVAGPIERAKNLLPQMLKPRIFVYEKAIDGCRQIIWGVFKKIVIADNCALYVNKVWADYAIYDGSTLLLAAILFAFQIYGDFSGYSDIAIGTSRLFGINLMRNFNIPYLSRNIAEFWRRWHISLNTWFVDYIYIPLGGSREGLTKSVRNTIVIFVLSGLWHGANWTFVAWGVFHAMLFVPLLMMKRNRAYLDVVAVDRWYLTLKECLQIFITFVLVVVGWVFFRAETITDAIGFLVGMCGRSLFVLPDFSLVSGRVLPIIFLALFILFIFEWINRRCEYAFERLPRNVVLRWAIYIFVCWFVMINFGSDSPFIYFQF